MTDERFEQLMRDAEQTFRTPPEPDLDGMWNVIATRTSELAPRQVVAMPERPTARGWFRSSDSASPPRSSSASDSDAPP